MDSDQEQLHAWRQQAWELVERNRVRPARDLLGRALAKFPEDQSLLLAAAWVEFIDDQNEAARRLCEQLLQLDPGSPGGRSLLAKIFRDMDAITEAEALYESLLRDFPDSADYAADYALMLVNTVHLDHAHALAQRAIELAPSHPQARQAFVFTSLMRGEHQNIDNMLRDMMASDPEAEETLFSLIAVLSDRGDKAGALRLAQELLRAQPNNTSLVELIIDLQHADHWSMRPLRWLDGDYGGLAAIALLGIGLATLTGHPAARVAGGVMCVYVVYGAVWPSLLKRLQR